MAKTLAARPQPTAVTRSNLKAEGDVKNIAGVTSLYEDMTNFLVWDAKQERNQASGKDEWCFKCMYAHGHKTDGSTPSTWIIVLDTKSTAQPRHLTLTGLAFILRELYEPVEGSDGEFIRKCKYSPQTDLAPDLFGKLEFFKEAFLFSWDQLPVFLKTLTDKVSTAIDPEEEGDDDDDEGQANNTAEREVITID